MIKKKKEMNDYYYHHLYTFFSYRLNFKFKIIEIKTEIIFIFTSAKSYSVVDLFLLTTLILYSISRRENERMRMSLISWAFGPLCDTSPSLVYAHTHFPFSFFLSLFVKSKDALKPDVLFSGNYSAWLHHFHWLTMN